MDSTGFSRPVAVATSTAMTMRGGQAPSGEVWKPKIQGSDNGGLNHQNGIFIENIWGLTIKMVFLIGIKWEMISVVYSGFYGMRSTENDDSPVSLGYHVSRQVLLQ